MIRNIKGYTKGYAVVIDNYQHKPEIVTWAGPGNIGTVNIEDFDVSIYPGPENMPNESCINVSTNVEQLILKNIKRKHFSAQEPTLFIRGKNTVIGSLELDGYYSLDTTGSSAISHILVDGSSINQLSISNVSIIRKQTETKDESVLLRTQNNSSVNSLQLSRINTDGITALISNPSGKLNIINASNVIYTNSSGHVPFYLDNDLNTVKALTISNFYGPGPIVGGKSRIVSKKGDAF